MKRLPFLLPLALITLGCQQAAISNEGRIASATRSGTYVAGVGKVAGGSEAIAWSPDGQTLAIATESATVLWPRGTTLPKLLAPLAWSADGTALAGWDGTRVVVEGVGARTRRYPKLPFRSAPSHLGWTSERKVFAWAASDELRVENGANLAYRGTGLGDVTARSDGGIAWIEGPHTGSGNPLAEALANPIRLVHWRPNGKRTFFPLGKMGDLILPSSPGRFSLPTTFALSPDGAGFVAGGVVVEGDPEIVSKLLTTTRNSDEKRLLKQARTRTVVALVDGSGKTREIWSAPLDILHDEIGVEDLSWSPDGKWLAIALSDRTVRVRL